MVFDSISSNIDEVLSINPSHNVFIFGDFNIHHKNWLTYSGGIDITGELCYKSSISNDLTQMVNFPTWIPDCDSHSPALLDLFLLLLVFVLKCPSHHWENHAVVSVSIDLLSNLKQDVLLHCIACDYSCADWDGLRDHLRDVPWGGYL